MIRVSSRVLLVLAWIVGTGLFALRTHPPRSLASARPALPATTINVTTPVDEFNSNNACSLREAVYAAVHDTATDACAAGGANDVIALPAATYTLTRYGLGEDGGLTGDLDITGTLRITGATSATTIIDGNRSDRIFDIFDGQVVLDDLTVRNGSSVSEGAGVNLRGALTADRVTFDKNLAISIAESNTLGGAISNPAGTLTVTASLFTGNGAAGAYMYNSSAGGAIYTGAAARSAITGSAFYDTQRSYYSEVIYNAGSLAIEDSTFARNPTPILNQGTATIEDSGFFANEGPVIWNAKNNLTVNRSEIAFNTPAGGSFYCEAGGGLFNEGTARLNQVFIHDNSMEYGGGIASTGETFVRDSAITGNRAPNGSRGREDCPGSGGGIITWGGSLDIANTTIADNWAEYNAGALQSISTTVLITNTTIVSNYADLNDLMIGHDNPPTKPAGGVLSNKPITLTNTLLARNGTWLAPGAADCHGPIVSANSLIQAPSSGCVITATASLIGIDPLLGALADHGGDTLTYDLLPDSPAIDAGAAAACPDHDQRGVFRPQDGDASGGAGCDIGAYEYANSGTAVTATPTTIPTATVPVPTSTAVATPATLTYSLYLPAVSR
ncbi:MAG TPA: choice-of-anchor Q domain-containing protein [Herpetosiphonaceae bacterium]|nr:choice-of-anchor Q domain-containing protein [Herpetosiphonaceae bacterium]